MKLNINKAMLLKNRFWIILGGSVCVILTGLFWLQTSDYAEADTNKNKSAFGTLKMVKDPFDSPPRIESLQELYAKAAKSESAIWLKAWDAQASLYQWPGKVEEEFEFHKGLFAVAITVADAPAPKDKMDQDEKPMYIMHGQLIDAEKDWLTIKNRKDPPDLVKFYRTKSVEKVLIAKDNKQVAFQELSKHRGKSVVVTYQKGRYFNEPLTEDQIKTYAESYKSQIHDILKSVDPYDINGNGVVQLRNWLYRKNEFPTGVTFIRFVNEPWRANFDFSREAWVAQENLWIQKEIYRIIREANDNISGFKEEGKPKNKTHIFKNNAFELHLSLNGEDLKLKIKNRLPKKQKLDMSFRIQMNKTLNPELIRIPLYLESAPALAAAPDPKNKDYVDLTIPKEKSARTGIFRVEQVLSWESAAVKRIDHISIASLAGGDISHSHRTFPDVLIPLEAQAGGDPKDPRPRPPAAGGPGMFAPGHGLWANRYLEVSEQSRRIPVCIVLIVDQSHVDRVLTAFNNSPLRFLSTQILLNHYTGSIQPPALPDKEGGKDIRAPMAGPVGGGGGGSGAEANMELVLYGVVTLYERFPPRPPGDKKQ